VLGVRIERDGDRQEKIKGDCSTGQSTQRAVVLMEGEEEGGGVEGEEEGEEVEEGEVEEGGGEREEAEEENEE
jgi:hypothetical protein